MITIVQLGYVVAVDKFRNFARASEHCFVTQPTLSMQIKKLEYELGIQIFDRSVTPVVPTEIGVRFIEQAKVILSESERIEDLVKSFRNDFSGGTAYRHHSHAGSVFAASFRGSIETALSGSRSEDR